MQILQVIFGQELPDTATSFGHQSFAVMVAAIGLAAFAVFLALVEHVRQAPSQDTSCNPMANTIDHALIQQAQMTALDNTPRVLFC